MSNGALTKPPEDKLHTFILSIVGSGVIGCFIFLWNVNGTLAKLEVQNMETARVIDELRIRINNMQLDIRDIRERVIRIESVKKQ